MEEDKNLSAGIGVPTQPEAKEPPESEEFINEPVTAVLEQEELPLAESGEIKSEPVKIEDISESLPTETISEDSAEKITEEIVTPAEQPAEDQIETVVDQSPSEPITEQEKPTVMTADWKKLLKNFFADKRSIIGMVIVLILIAIAVFACTKQAVQEKGDYSSLKIKVSSELEQGKVSIIEETSDDINVITETQTQIKLPNTEVIAFFANSQKDPGASDCQRVFALKKEIPKRYDSNLLNSVLALLEPLTAKEKEAGYLSVIPANTFLKYIKLDDSGVAVANFSGGIGKAAGSCAVSAIRAQITETLMQFAAVKSVVICIDDNCLEDEILQP